MTTVLIVDNELATRHYLRAFLKRCGYKILFANDGLCAAAIIGRANIDLIVSDWKMPRMDGVSLFNFVRGRRFSMRIPFILMTEEPDPPLLPFEALIGKPPGGKEVQRLARRYAPPRRSSRFRLPSLSVRGKVH
jgi:CheY-like chemotaxis protein